jgi:hypothetical protein
MFSVKIFCFTILLVVSYGIVAQNCTSYLPGIRTDLTAIKLCPEVMLEDLQKLRESLDKIHPDLYHYVTKEQLDSAYRVTVRKVSNELTAYEFSRTLALFLSTIKDSHTNYNAQSSLFLGPKDKGTLPFFLIKIQDKFYLESIYNDQSLNGKEILQLNDYTVQDIFNESKNFSIIEGSAYAAQDEIATKGMALTFSQLNYFKASDSIMIKYVSDGDTLIKKLKATNKMNLYFFKGPLIKKSVTYFFDQENKGILKILSFQPKTMRFFKKEVAKFFDEVEKRNCNEIIIDLRDNQGGYVKAQEYLISFLNFKKKPTSIQHVYKRSNLDPFVKMPYFKKMKFIKMAKREYPSGIHNKEYDFMMSEIGSVHKIVYSNLPQNEYNTIYSGKCTLVMNGLSMSASVLFAGWFRKEERGWIIGSPCLGSMSGTFGSSVSIVLPGTGLPVVISTIKFNPTYAQKVEIYPIFPDKLIEYTVNDVLQGQDPVWNYLNIKTENDQSLKYK